MFTGIVEELGEVVALDRPRRQRPADACAARSSSPTPRHGDSIAVNGVCLTVVDVDADGVHRRRHARDPRPQLPRRAGGRRPGQPRARRCALGRPARRPPRPGPRRRHRRGSRRREPSRALGGRAGLAARRPGPLRREKGSITVDGVSLTVAVASDDSVVHRQPDPDHPRAHHPRPQAGRRPGEPRGRRRRQVRRAAAAADPAPPSPRERTPHERVQRPVRGPPDDRRPRHHLAGDRRQRVRPGVRRRRHAPQGLGLAGGHHRQRPAVHGLPRSPRPRATTAAARCTARPAARCSSSSCRSTAGGAGRQNQRSGAGRRPSCPRWATGRRARGVPRRRPRSGWWSATSRSARSAPASRPTWWFYLADAWIFVGSIAGDLRHGPRLGRLLAAAGSRWTWSACRCCCTRTSTRRPSSTASTASSSSGASSPGCGLRAPRWPARRRRLDDRTRCGHERRRSGWTRSSGRSPTSRPARPSSSSTTRTARTRATWSSPRRRRRRSCWRSWSGTPPGVVCVPMEGRRAGPAQAAADDRGQRGPQAHRVRRVGRRPRRHRHRHLGRRPGPHDPGAGRLGHRAVRADPARATSSRCARSRAACCAAPGTPRRRSTWPGSPGSTPAGVDRRGRQRRRLDGAAARAARVRRRARPGAGVDRRPGRLPPAYRDAGRAGGRGPAADPARRVPGASATAARSTAPSTSPWCAARSATGTGRAGPAALRVPHRGRARVAALRLRTAAGRRAAHGRRGRAAASSSTCAATRAAGSACCTSSPAYRLQDGGRDTVDANLDLGLPADARDFSVGAQILGDLGVTSVRLLTNNPAKRAGRRGARADRRRSRCRCEVHVTPENIGYLRTKRDRMGHDLPGLGRTPTQPTTRSGWHERGRVARTLEVDGTGCGSPSSPRSGTRS